MKRSFIIKNELGLHARPISKWLAVFKESDALVNVFKGDKKFNGKSMISLMQTAAKKDDEITVEIIGDSEDILIEELSLLIEDGFGE
ncbi:HPr family phosphocarrier protein [Acidaminobacter sp. JC074]|uniref:HPr family phosphocarrier protein n=1 Tax=Acidaminobacter sp. JC074 TaxID=2530199 RepID=UPI001F0E961F|nr:HPr family phosphocarrier protein [Acidaminobacter sp. JC074]MCH4887912.1 HPr family phosphocarrier protein [Acidaminobacter sp. JC074]